MLEPAFDELGVSDFDLDDEWPELILQPQSTGLTVTEVNKTKYPFGQQTKLN